MIYATINNPITTCNGAGRSIPEAAADRGENDDHKSACVNPRNIFDLGIGADNLFHREKEKFTVSSTSRT